MFGFQKHFRDFAVKLFLKPPPDTIGIDSFGWILEAILRFKLN